jgi:hypothetical protein
MLLRMRCWIALLILGGCGGPEEPATTPGPARDPATEAPPVAEAVAEEPAPQPPPEEPPTGPDEEPSLLDVLEPEERAAIEAAATIRPRSRAALQSEELRAVWRAITADLARARRAAPGERNRYAGRTYVAVAYALDGPDLVGELRGMVRAHLRPDPPDFVFYSRAEPHPTTVDAAVTQADLVDGPLEMAAREREAVVRLATRLAELAGAHPALRGFQLQAGWGDAVGGAYHGTAFVDPETGEALWIHRAEYWREE